MVNTGLQTVKLRFVSSMKRSAVLNKNTQHSDSIRVGKSPR